MTVATMLWRRLDKPGHDAARLVFLHPHWSLTGTAVFAHEQRPCRLDYEVLCNAQWKTLSGKIEGWIGLEPVNVYIDVGSDRCWLLNGAECPEVSGCVDLDLSFSPSTNIMAVRRLGLAIGQRATAPAAWMTFPSLKLERLEQIYHHIDAFTYRYESAGGEFVTELQVNTEGFVTHYPDFWQVEAQQPFSVFPTNQS